MTLALAARLGLPALLLALCAPALAQETGVIYRGVDAQGKTVFSHNPKDMRNPKKVELSPPILSGVDAYPVSAAPLGAPAAAKPSEPPASAGAPALTRSEALERLNAAKKALAEGAEPRPGERTGTANGGTRLNPSYESRQRELSGALSAAQKAYDSAHAD